MKTLSLVLTINNRPPEVSQQVAESLKLPGNQPDNLIVVLDRPTDVARKGALEAYSELPFATSFVEVEGEQGWKGPAKAWNAGFEQVSSDLTYMISSEVTQDQGNIGLARELSKTPNTAVFGACHNSTKEKLVQGVEAGLLVCAEFPRPLGFIACIPTKNIQQINGFDETFMKGFWFDDDDFFLRLWKTGLNFMFYNDIHGIHINHNRPDLDTQEGRDKTELNRLYMIKKHGKCHPWPTLPKIEKKQQGITTWTHV